MPEKIPYAAIQAGLFRSAADVRQKPPDSHPAAFRAIADRSIVARFVRVTERNGLGKGGSRPAAQGQVNVKQNGIV